MESNEFRVFKYKAKLNGIPNPGLFFGCYFEKAEINEWIVTDLERSVSKNQEWRNV